MNWPAKIRITKLIIFLGSIFVVSACGVKGDPLPPLRPAQLGRGRPTYQRATEKIEIGEKAGDSPKPLPSLNNKVRGVGEAEDE